MSDGYGVTLRKLGMIISIVMILCACSPKPEAVMLPLSARSDAKRQIEMEFHIGESASSVKTRLDENDIYYDVVYEKASGDKLYTFVCRGETNDYYKYYIVIFEESLLRVEVESGIDGRGVLIPASFDD